MMISITINTIMAFMIKGLVKGIDSDQEAADSFSHSHYFLCISELLNSQALAASSRY